MRRNPWASTSTNAKGKGGKTEKREKSEKAEKHEKREYGYIGPLIGGLILIAVGLMAYL